MAKARRRVRERRGDEGMRTDNAPPMMLCVFEAAMTAGMVYFACVGNVCATIAFATMLLSADFDTLKYRLGLYQRTPPTEGGTR